MNQNVNPAGWVGQLIDQRFPLLEWLGSAESGDFFRTELPGPEAQNAAVRLVPADVEGAQEQFDDWAQAEGLAHPNLLRIFESGRGRIDENELLYVVMELPDEALSQVLPTRALSREEAAEMLPPILSALAYLHARGLVHGHVNPDNILVVGDGLKLSADKLQHAGRLPRPHSGPKTYDAPEIARDGVSPASDVWSLGITLVEALTQLPPIWNTTPGGDPKVPQFVPEPYASIASKCLRVNPANRATLAELEAVLNAPAVRSPSIPSPPRPSPPRQAAPPPTPAPEAPAVAPLAAAPPPPQQPQPSPAAPEQVAFSFDDLKPSRRNLWTGESEDETPNSKPRTQPHAQPRPERRTATGNPAPTRPSTPLIVGAAALLLVIVAAVLLRSHKSAPPPPQATQTESAPAPTPPPKAPPHRRPEKAAEKVPDKSSRGPKGEVAERVMPDVSEKASRTIRGKVTVRVRVSVDRDGAVSNASFDSAGSSRYFANLALQTARKWRFKAPQSNGRSEPSVWTIRFDFRRGKTDVTPVEVTP